MTEAEFMLAGDVVIDVSTGSKVKILEDCGNSFLVQYDNGDGLHIWKSALRTFRTEMEGK